MPNTQEININIPDILPDIVKDNKCSGCPHRDKCIFNNALKEKSYERKTRDFLNETEEGTRQVFICPCHDEEKLSTTKGLFGNKRWYPTYLILLCVSLVLDQGIPPAFIVNVLFADAATQAPSQSTIYRWVKEYLEYMKNQKKSKHADVFNPIKTLGKLCRKACATVKEKKSSVFDLFNNYVKALQRVFGIPTRTYTIKITC